MSERAQAGVASRSLPGCAESRQDPLGVAQSVAVGALDSNRRDLKLHQKTIQYR